MPVSYSMASDEDVSALKGYCSLSGVSKRASLERFVSQCRFTSSGVCPEDVPDWVETRVQVPHSLSVVNPMSVAAIETSCGPALETKSFAMRALKLPLKLRRRSQ